MVSLYFRNSRLHVIPTTLFAVHDELSVHLYMDASDHGRCVLDVSMKRFIILSWDTMERNGYGASMQPTRVLSRSHHAVFVANAPVAPQLMSF